MIGPQKGDPAGCPYNISVCSETPVIQFEIGSKSPEVGCQAEWFIER